jgi:ATP-dependent DNA helicase PIF1
MKYATLYLIMRVAHFLYMVMEGLVKHSYGQLCFALAVASSGIAVLLLPGGRTPHSHFKIPLDIKQNSMYNTKKNTHLSKLIIQASLIIWDEAPINHSYC